MGKDRQRMQKTATGRMIMKQEHKDEEEDKEEEQNRIKDKA